MQCPNCGSFGVDSGDLDYAICRICGYNWTPSVEPDWNGELVVRGRFSTDHERLLERNPMLPDRAGDDDDDEEEDLDEDEEDFEDADDLDNDFDDDFEDEADDSWGDDDE